MKNAMILGFCLLFVFGCSTDIVTTSRLHELDVKCVHVLPLQSDENSSVGQVLRDVIEKEFVRKQVGICNEEGATIFVSGSAFMTNRAESDSGWFGSSSVSTQALESISLVAKDRDGNVLISASYDNKDRKTASRAGKELGSQLAAKLK